MILGYALGKMTFENGSEPNESNLIFISYYQVHLEGLPPSRRLLVGDPSKVVECLPDGRQGSKQIIVARFCLSLMKNKSKLSFSHAQASFDLF